MRKLVVNSLLGVIVAVFLAGNNSLVECNATENVNLVIPHNSKEVSEPEHDIFDGVEVIYRAYDDAHPYPGMNIMHGIQERVKNMNVPDKNECIRRIQNLKDKVEDMKKPDSWHSIKDKIIQYLF